MKTELYGIDFGIAGAESFVKRSLADLQSDGGLAHSQSSGDHAAGARQLFGVNDPLATALASSRCGSGQSSAGAFADQVTLELSERAKKMED